MIKWNKKRQWHRFLWHTKPCSKNPEAAVRLHGFEVRFSRTTANDEGCNGESFAQSKNICACKKFGIWPNVILKKIDLEVGPFQNQLFIQGELSGAQGIKRKLMTWGFHFWKKIGASYLWWRENETFLKSKINLCTHYPNINCSQYSSNKGRRATRLALSVMGYEVLANGQKFSP